MIACCCALLLHMINLNYSSTMIQQAPQSQDNPYLKIRRRHLVAPKVLFLPSLVQGGLQLLAQPLGVLATLVLRHAEQDRSSIGG